MRRLALAAFSLALLGCLQSTGGELVGFGAVARGATGADQPFTTPTGYQVQLSRARVWVGALYLSQSNPANYSEETSCVLPGLYTGEVRGGLEVDALSSAPQPFAVEGNGTDAPTHSAQLWLSDGEVDAADSRRVVLSLEGVASRGAERWPFAADYTIGKNRVLPPRNPALPGSNPLCKQRIVTPIASELRLSAGGLLTLTIDPRAFFASAELSSLSPDPDQAGRFRFIDDAATAGQPDAALYNGLRSVAGPYSLTFTP